MDGPTLNESVEWRKPIWTPAVASALDRAAPLLHSDAKVLEIGYNTGMMSCYLASHYGWNMIGYDISDSVQFKAIETARNYGLEEKVDFRVCLPEETLNIKGSYDAVLLKSVLYHISDKRIYRYWLDWLHSAVRDGGIVIAIENGKGGLVDRIYRKHFRKSRWAGFLLFNKWAEQEFQKRFWHVDIRYFGRFAQFFCNVPKLCKIVLTIEKKIFPANAEHCFIASIVARK